MQYLTRLLWSACVVAGGLACCAASVTADVEAVGPQTPWRVFLVKGGNLVREDGVLRYRRGRDFADIKLVATSRKLGVSWTRGRETVRDEVDLDSPNPWFSQMPPVDWPEPDFDDAHWARYQPDELADFLGEYGRRINGYNGYLSQHELGYDWPGYAARVQEAAAELEGVKTAARWDSPS